MRLEGRVFITGGAGFIARALYLRARAEAWPVTFTAYGHGGRLPALRERFPEVRVFAGDVAGSVETMAGLMSGHDLVIHAAAEKYVDLSEFNAFTALDTNVIGSKHVALAAYRAGVPRVLAISTDKACEPVNFYGMTKAVMERLWLEADAKFGPSSRYYCVRYGNVIGSTGSVAPMFKKQLAEHGAITVTNPKMTRYWMTVDEAIDTILWALDSGPGEVVIPQPRSAPLTELIRATMGSLDDSQMRIAGERPGEKLHEALVGLAESPRVREESPFPETYLVGYEALVGLAESPRVQPAARPRWIGDAGWYYLQPPGQLGDGLMFVESSETAPAISAEELAEAIKEAESI